VNLQLNSKVYITADPIFQSTFHIWQQSASLSELANGGNRLDCHSVTSLSAKAWIVMKQKMHTLMAALFFTITVFVASLSGR
jgi:hypothetical protein